MPASPAVTPIGFASIRLRTRRDCRRTLDATVRNQNETGEERENFHVRPVHRPYGPGVHGA